MHQNMMEDIDHILLSKEELQAKVAEIGAQISKDYQGKNLLLLSVLRGSFIFMADLARAITVPLSVDFMSASSYGSSTKTSGAVKITKDIDIDIEGKDVIVVEDILDSGLTLSFLMGLLKAKKPASLHLCALLDKPERRKAEVNLTYKGFTVPDEFVVGYGLDYDEKYRNLPFIGVLKPEVYSK